MFITLLEDETLKARHCQALTVVGLAAGLIVSGSVSTLDAQSTRTPDPNAPRMMVGTLKGTEKNLGVQAADAIRSRLNQDIPYKQLWVIPKNDINATLEASGFPTTEALASHDAKALANLLRADEYVSGTVTKNGAMFRVEGQLVLARDNTLIQPIPAVEANRLDLVASQFSKELQSARKQLDDERKCVNLARESKFAEAAAAARQGIADYPRATLARACLAGVLREMKAPGDSVLAVANEILAIDPKNRYALTYAAQTYKDAGQPDKAIEALTTLLSTDPSNTRLIEQVSTEVAQTQNPGVALPIIRKAVQENPGDPQLLNTQWLIERAAREYKAAIATGEELIKADTAMATAEFYTFLARVYAADSQPQKAAEAAARGVAKFPNNGGLLVTQADFLLAAGQNQQALDALNRAIAADPKTAGVYLTRARIQADLNQSDSAFVSLRTAAANGDAPSEVAKYALSIGNNAYKAANASKQRPDYEKAIRYLQYSDSLEASDQAKFLIGATSLTLGQTLATEAQKTRSCDLSRAAQNAFADAAINLPRGGKFNPQATTQFMGYLQQLQPAGEALVKANCK
jgi:tetratricopeptide (TPR) repeat protein